MNSRQCGQWLEAAAACDPGGSYDGPLRLVSALGAAAPGALWEGAVSGGDASALRVACRPPKTELAAARAALSSLLPAAARQASADPRAWLDAAWEGRGGGRWTETDFGARFAKLRRRPFSAEIFAAPVSETLIAFSALCPIVEIQDAPGRTVWTLILAKPEPWPTFLRCDAAAAFAPRAAQLSLLLRDARVRALDFDGEALWARFVG